MRTNLVLFLLTADCLLDRITTNVITNGCKTNMRLFGPNDEYECNCKELAFCSFKQNGKCKTDECRFPYGGPYCQTILYDQRLIDEIPEDKNIFRNRSKTVQNNFQLIFNSTYRINTLGMTCETSANKFSIFIGDSKFCDFTCSNNVLCIGDMTGEYLLIQTHNDIQISSMKITGCSTGWFGEKCDKQCHCADGKECHKITGHCPEGCEIGRRGPDCQALKYENVALHKRSEQSSTKSKDVILVNGTCKEAYFKFSSDLAVDGNTDQRHERLSCMHTGTERYPIWTVHLGKTYTISQIRIYNRDFENSDRLGEYTVFVGKEECKELSKDIVKLSKIIDVTCDKKLRGDSVTIKHNVYNVYERELHICEVEVLQCLPGFYGKRCNNACRECKNSSCDQVTGECLLGCAPNFQKQPTGNKCIVRSQTTPMKYRGHIFLIFSLILYFREADFAKKGDAIWDKSYERPNKTTEGCGIDMRYFGPDNRYYCNCKKISSCDFGKNGQCQQKGCGFGYRGEYCQMISYHSYLKNMSHPENVFTENSTEIEDALNITFRFQYRINTIQLMCRNQTETNISLYIGSRKFCEQKCQTQKFKCYGDVTGHNLFINATSNVALSNMRIYGCSPGWFGKKCNKQCHCADDSECHKITGKCPNRCESGRHGIDCQALNYENVALNKTATQSSTYGFSTLLTNTSCKDTAFQFSASLAVDGNTDQQHERKACSHTKSERNSKWTVDLGKKYNISQIRIYNRNLNMYRLQGTSIYVDGILCKRIDTKEKIIDIECNGIRNGQEILFQKYTSYNKVFQLCEVEVLQCLPGFHGYRCNTTCPECNESMCDQWSGECLAGCALGYFDTPCKVCHFGRFGKGCSETCHCKNNNNCNKENGTCGEEGCAAGYHGYNCQEPCSFRKFGYGCKKTCHCKNNNNCNKENGTCGEEGCAAGYHEYNCQEPCPFRKFGYECKETCRCKNNINCNKENGTCGEDGCEVGYIGYNCQEPCSFGYFGEGCLQKCHCSNNSYCSRKTGTCERGGCADGYKGYNCQETKTNILLPIIIVTSLLLIIFISVALYITCKKIKNLNKNKSNRQPKISLTENIQMDPVVDDDDDDDFDDFDDNDFMEPMDNEESIYMNYENQPEKPTGLTKDDLLSYVKKKKMEDLPFADEFLKLPKGLLYAHNAATDEKNRRKNRYKTILPYDHSRVRLKIDENSSSDYINANYLTKNKTYIATQGPLTSTMADFWRMVHETQVHIIVMLTNLSENGKLKSEQYWPDVGMTRTYGVISVSHRTENKHSSYTYRQFCITKNSENFWVEQYQFTSWPDHGVPENPEYFISFRNKVRSTQLYKPPILVHCSAGVGRSGSYIILDIILEEMKNKPKIDIIEWILDLRRDRTLMVQNRKQLEFIYDVLVESITTGSTMVQVSDLPQVYNQLLKFSEKINSSYLKQQFEKFLLPLSTVEDNCSNTKPSSAIYCNQQYIADDENDEPPIDATILCGNNSEEEFILMSTPSEETFADFWNTVFLKRCTMLVMFDDLIDEASAYWPEKDSVANYQHIVVEFVEENHNEHYSKRTMKVSSTKLNIPELLVHQIQFKIWLNSEFPSPNEILDIIQIVQTLQSSQSKKQITLHCRDGISKNGMFCVLYMMIELLQTDTVISIVQLIRLVKKTKKEIIPDYMSYHYCWLVAKVYLQELSLYSNVANDVQTSS